MNKKARPLQISEMVSGMEKFPIWFHDSKMKLFLHLATGGAGRGKCPIASRAGGSSCERGPDIRTKNILPPNVRMWNSASSQASTVPLQSYKCTLG